MYATSYLVSELADVLRDDVADVAEAHPGLADGNGLHQAVVRRLRIKQDATNEEERI